MHISSAWHTSQESVKEIGDSGILDHTTAMHAAPSTLQNKLVILTAEWLVTLAANKLERQWLREVCFGMYI